MVQLVILNARATMPAGVDIVDIAIDDGKILAIGSSGAFNHVEAERYDAGGRLVIPGGIDPHVHCSLPIFVPNQKDLMVSDPPAVVSRAALHGGTTTLIDFVFTDAESTLQQAIERKQAQWEGQTYCDYSLHVTLSGDVTQDKLGELPSVIQQGYPSIKIFTTDITPSRRGRLVDFGDIWEILRINAKHGGILAVHAEDNDVVMHMYEKLTREGRTHFSNLAEVHNVVSEDLSFHRVIRLAANVEGAALYMMHVSAELGVRAVQRAREENQPVYGEALHQYLLYNADDYKRKNGQIYHTYPSLKFPADQAALWKATDRGAIQAVATDEVCCPLSVKLQGERIDDTTGGNSGVEPRVSIMYTETVVKRGYSLQQFVDLVSTNAAKILGLYPRKGVIAVGADADLVVLEERRRTIRNSEMHESDYSPWEGREVDVWPLSTFLRGKLVVDRGTFSAALTSGRFEPRSISDEIRSRAAV